MSFNYVNEIKNLAIATLDILDNEFIVKMVDGQDVLVKKDNDTLLISLDKNSNTVLRIYEYSIIKDIIAITMQEEGDIMHDDILDKESGGFALAIMEHLTDVENILVYIAPEESLAANLFNALDYYRNKYFDRIYDKLLKNGIRSIQDIHNQPIKELEKRKWFKIHT